MKVYALAIIAHPDDEAFLFAGTSFKFDQQGKSLGIVCATGGEKGDSRLKKKLTKTQLAKVRCDELRAAAKILRADFVKFLNYDDGGLDKINFEKLAGQLSRLIDHYQPKLILTFGREGISGHKDHITIGQAAVAATKKSKHKVSEIWRASLPASVMKTFNKYLLKIRVHHAHFHPHLLKGVPDKRLQKVDIRKFRAKKLQALYCHKSQGLPPWMVHNFPKVRDHFLSYECFEVSETIIKITGLFHSSLLAVSGALISQDSFVIIC